MAREKQWISIKALSDVLDEIIARPSEWLQDKELISALRSQGKLAKWESTSRKITGCSLNTLKSSSDAALNDGFAGIDRRRIKALRAIESEDAKNKHPRRGTRLSLEEKIKQQDIKIAALESRNMLLTYIICELQTLTDNAILSCDSEVVALRYKRNLEVIYSKLSACGEDQLVEMARGFDNA